MEKVKEGFELEKKIASEISSLSEDLKSSTKEEERRIIIAQIKSLKDSLRRQGQKMLEAMENVSVSKPLTQEKIDFQAPLPQKPLAEEKVEKIPMVKKEKMTALEKMALKRMKRKEVKVVKKRERKPSTYVKMASKMFYNTSMRLLNKGRFDMLRRDNKSQP